MENAASETTIAELKALCAVEEQAGKEDSDKPSQMVVAERQAKTREFAITPHKPNFFVPFSYNDTPNSEAFSSLSEFDPVEEYEAIIQVSVKVPLVKQLAGTDNDIYFAYTTRAWWQAYNSEFSKPFRETNYEPEVFIRHYPSTSLLGIRILSWDAGYVHQSNGRSQLLSRSWDRIFGQLNIKLDDELSLYLKTWYRLPESDEEDELINEYRFYGYGETRLVYSPGKSTFTLLYRPGTKKQAAEVTWSRPVSDYLRVYTSLYSGYGESLLDFDQSSQRISIGIALNDYMLER